MMKKITAISIGVLVVAFFSATHICRAEVGQKKRADVFSYVVEDARSFNRDFSKFLSHYTNEVRDVFGGRGFASDFKPEESDFYMLTTRECNSKFMVVYTDGRTFFSYRAECFRYTGGAHGSTIIKVGTIDVKTGRRLQVADVIPADKRAEALARVRKAVIAEIGGEGNLMPSAETELAALPENFYVGKDGLHFVFAEYSVAAYHYAPDKYGSVEIVIPAYGKYARPQGPR